MADKGAPGITVVDASDPSSYMYQIITNKDTANYKITSEFTEFEGVTLIGQFAG